MIRLGTTNDEWAENLWIMCARDPLFFVNTFLWTFDPRLLPKATRIPFITYPYQDNALLDIIDCIGTEDLVIEKSRDMGASWLVLVAYVWYWQFKDMVSFMVASRKEDLVDKSEDPDCLYWKIDFMISCQPGFLQPKVHRTKLHLSNMSNGSTIDGSSTTGDLGRGGRRTSVMVDEFASVEQGYEVLSATADVTQSRILPSTPKGTGNAFYDLVESDILRLRFHWPLHPVKSEGLYLDSEGKPRSPWYDAECERRKSKLEIAQELDIDYQASGSAFFDGESLQRARKEDVMVPRKRGIIDVYDDQSGITRGHFTEGGKQNLLLWAILKPSGSPPDDRQYSLGADIAAGTGASSSCVSVADCKSGEKVAEFADNTISPEEFARLCSAIGHWFKGPIGPALITWEANGTVGAIFTKEIVRLGYPALYKRRDEKTAIRKRSNKPGFWSDPQTKAALLGEYRRALSGKHFINRSIDALNEASEYVYTPGGGVEHARSLHTIDASDSKHNHGDRAMADALCWHGMKEQYSGDKKSEEKRLITHSFAGRRQRRREQMKESKLW